MSEEIVIKQNGYPDLEIDPSEKDIVQIWQQGFMNLDVIQIERESIPALITALQKLREK